MNRNKRSCIFTVLSLFALLLGSQYACADEGPTNSPSRHEHDEGKVAPLSPRAHPYALAVNSGIVPVRFSVRMTGKKNQATTVYLRRTGVQESIAMNDQGVNGDHRAGDNIYGASIPVDTSALASDTCLSYEAFINNGGAEVVSAPLQLCVSSLPVRTATSNKSRPAKFPDGTIAVADEILFTANPNVSATEVRLLASSVNATVVGSIPPLNLYQLKLSAPRTASQLLALIAQLTARPEVKAASVNAIGHSSYVPSDTEYASQQGLQLIRAQDVWDAGATGSGVIVTVLDSGIDRTHPDFGTTGNCQLAENDCGGAITDAIGHGTQVAGIIAAKTNNAIGVAGIAYGSKIHSIQVSPDAVITDLEMTQGFTNAASYGNASVINASFSVANAAVPSWTPVCAAIDLAVLNAGVPVAVVVNAVGNLALNANFYPARCNDLNAGLTRKELLITVANSASVVTSDCSSVAIDQLCSTSNYGAWVDIAAPGSAIRTTTLVSGGSYASPSGTSFSSPMVAGAVAILKSCGVPLDQIESTLRNSANVMVPYPASGANPAGSTPRLDIYRALAQVNHTPTAVGLSNSSLNDGTDTTAGVEVGTLTVTDVDTCDKHSYSILPGADAASFSIGGAANNKLILSAGVLSIASKSSYAVTLRVTDYFGSTFDQAVTVNVIAAPPVNHAPVIANQSFSINENSANGTVVGTVFASDPDAGNTISYSITAGNTGDAFALNTTTGALTVNNTLSYATTQAYALTVKVTDNGGLYATATVTVNVNETVTPPPPAGGGGGGGCSVMPAGADPDLSLALAVLVLLGYGVRRRLIRNFSKSIARHSRAGGNPVV